MKKRTIVTALLGVVLAACGNGTTVPPDENPFVYSDVVDGKRVEVTVSRAQPDEDTTAPEAGDFFVIRAEGAIVSKGTITALDTGGKAAFTPSRDSPGPGTAFPGTFSSGGRGLSLPVIPTAEGDIVGFEVTPPVSGGSSPGGGGSGGGGGGGSGGGSGGGGGDTAPGVPANVLAVSSSSSEITVSWSAVSGADTYRVYKSESDSGTYSLAGSAASTSYTDTGLSAETTYYYKVSALASGGGMESAQSSPVQAITCYEPGPADYAPVSGGVEITDYSGTSTHVRIPAEIGGAAVVAIGFGAFAGNLLESVVIPGSITDIGVGAFENNQLTGVIIGAGVKTIGDIAFDFNQLTGITIPDSVTGIGIRAFSNNQLTSVTIGAGVEFIEDGAFDNNQLESVVIPDSVTTIGDDAFSNNPLTRITIGAGVTLGNYPFDFGGNFAGAYAADGAGTYTRPDVNSAWAKEGD